MLFASERLQFRPMEENDFEFYFKVFGDREVMKLAMLDPFENREALRPYFNKLLLHNLEDKQVYAHIICTTHHTSIGVGELEITAANGHGGIGEIGYFLLPSYWGKGYATEAAAALCKIGFEQYGVHKIFAGCHADNTDSKKIMKKIGMQLEARLRVARYKDGSWHDEVRYSILKEEWN